MSKNVSLAIKKAMGNISQLHQNDLKSKGPKKPAFPKKNSSCANPNDGMDFLNFGTLNCSSLINFHIKFLSGGKNNSFLMPYWLHRTQDNCFH